MPHSKSSNMKHPYIITNQLSDITENALDKVDKTVDTVQQKVTQYYEPIEQYAQKYPLRAMGMAVAGGFLLAHFLRLIHKL